MAEITGKIRVVTPVNEGVYDRGVFVQDVDAGTPLVETVNGWDKAAANATEFHGVAAKDTVAGETSDILIQGEMAGFLDNSGDLINGGEALFVSATPGVLDDGTGTPPAGLVTQARTRKGGRVYFNCV